jgi:hypothetical protein
VELEVGIGGLGGRAGRSSQVEVTCVAQFGVNTVGESEQLLARLVLVIDQALSTG